VSVHPTSISIIWAAFSNKSPRPGTRQTLQAGCLWNFIFAINNADLAFSPIKTSITWNFIFKYHLLVIKTKQNCNLINNKQQQSSTHHLSKLCVLISSGKTNLTRVCKLCECKILIWTQPIRRLCSGSLPGSSYACDWPKNIKYMLGKAVELFIGVIIRLPEHFELYFNDMLVPLSVR